MMQTGPFAVRLLRSRYFFPAEVPMGPGIPNTRFSKNRLLMPSLFFYQKNSPAFLFPSPVPVKCIFAAHLSAGSFIMNFFLSQSLLFLPCLSPLQDIPGSILPFRQLQPTGCAMEHLCLPHALLTTSAALGTDPFSEHLF